MCSVNVRLLSVFLFGSVIPISIRSQTSQNRLSQHERSHQQQWYHQQPTSYKVGIEDFQCKLFGCHVMESHAGEDAVQAKRGVPERVRGAAYNYTSSELPDDQQEFFSKLDYLAISTTDERNRPWATLLVLASPESRVEATYNTLTIHCLLPAKDPFATAAVKGGGKFAAVGVDFTNRRRNKVQGSITSATVEPLPTDPDRVSIKLTLKTTEVMGNCPKYITVRALEHAKQTTPKAVMIAGDPSHEQPIDNEGHGITLDQRCKTIINASSSIWLATRHLTHGYGSDLGLNHRGGIPGFVRTYDEGVATTRDDDNGSGGNGGGGEGDGNGGGGAFLVIPDYSGNRFYQSLGNVQSDNVAGVLFVDFVTGDLLHITGVAENHFDADAELLMPRVTLVTRIRVTGVVLMKHGLDLKLTSPEKMSPYNPPIRPLAVELKALGQVVPTTLEQLPMATLTSIKRVTDSVSTFEFSLDRPVQFVPGGYAVFDFSKLINRTYSHMNERNPQQVNDDYIRTWTISSAPPYFDPVSREFHATDVIHCTIRCKPTGTISRLLHSINPEIVSAMLKDQPFKVPLIGTAGDFSCFTNDQTNRSDSSGPVSVPTQMVWIAGGVGITPFIAMCDALVKTKAITDVVLLFACRGLGDLAMLNQFKPMAHDGVTIKVVVFDSSPQPTPTPSSTVLPTTTSTPTPTVSSTTLTSTAATWPVYHRRMSSVDIQKEAPRLLTSTVFVCGPPALNKAATEWVIDAGVDATKITTEKFDF
eukprot:m.164306 g.164306  ORF g.164306 m.164306 type:complete len:758 (+) comp31335_c0_seq2:135-2408(+)